MQTFLKILIIVAMQQEADPLIRELNLSQKTTFDTALPMIIYTNPDASSAKKIYLVVNGLDPVNKVDAVATQPAAISVLMAIKTYDPDIIINAGTAGGFKDKGAEIGDIYVATKVFYHDRRIPIPGFSRYGMGGYICDSIPELAADLKLKKGIVSTGNSLDLQPKDLEIILKNNASVKDMEAASVAWIAGLYGKRVIILKSITDFVDYPETDASDFIRNLNTASGTLSTKCVGLIRSLKIDKRKRK